MPGGVLAEGASALWNIQLRSGPSVSARTGYSGAVAEFELGHFNSGGMGARPTKDGLAATSFPSGVRGVPVEATEMVAPIIFWRKELRADSGGSGRWRGGLGQWIEVGGDAGAPFDVLAMFDRVDHPARGRDGGGPGASGSVHLASGPPLAAKGQQSVPPGDRLVLGLPGGGGFGDPYERAPEQVADDVAAGLVSREAARRDYGVVVDENGNLDEAATAQRRQ